MAFGIEWPWRRSYDAMEDKFVGENDYPNKTETETETETETQIKRLEAEQNRLRLLNEMAKQANSALLGAPTIRHKDVYAMGQTIAGGSMKANAPQVSNIERPTWREHVISMRMQLNEGEKLPFDEITTALGDELVYVMIVVNGKGVMLEDERGLFPSDTLITRLRLIAK